MSSSSPAVGDNDRDEEEDAAADGGTFVGLNCELKAPCTKLSVASAHIRSSNTLPNNMSSWKLLLSAIMVTQTLWLKCLQKVQRVGCGLVRTAGVRGCYDYSFEFLLCKVLVHQHSF